MIIPASFKLFGNTIKVKYKRNLLDIQQAFGVCDYIKHTIYIQQSTRENPLTKDQIEQTFIHESCHMLLFLMGEQKLADNEKFICSFSNLLHQFIKETNG